MSVEDHTFEVTLHTLQLHNSGYKLVAYYQVGHEYAWNAKKAKSPKSSYYKDGAWNWDPPAKVNLRVKDRKKDVVKVFFNEQHTLSEQFIGELYIPLHEIKTGETVTIEASFTKNPRIKAKFTVKAGGHLQSPAISHSSHPEKHPESIPGYSTASHPESHPEQHFPSSPSTVSYAHPEAHFPSGPTASYTPHPEAHFPADQASYVPQLPYYPPQVDSTVPQPYLYPGTYAPPTDGVPQPYPPYAYPQPGMPLYPSPGAYPPPYAPMFPGAPPPDPNVTYAYPGFPPQPFAYPPPMTASAPSGVPQSYAYPPPGPGNVTYNVVNTNTGV